MGTQRGTIVLYNTLLVFINSHVEDFGRYEMHYVKMKLEIYL